MKKNSLILVAICFSAAALGFAQEGSVAAPPSGSNEPIIVRPKMTISNETPEPSLLLKDREFLEPSFRNADPEIPFPARARLDHVYAGRAAVGVMLDAEGNATDFLIVRYSKLYFAEKVMDVIRHEEFNPRRVKTTPVPGRFFVVRAFSMSESDPIGPDRPATVSMNAMDQMGTMSNRTSEGKDGPKLIYKARGEPEIDGKILKVVVVDAPVLPAGYELQPNQALKVIVSFYVDEKGNVRQPNVDSNTPALVIPSIIKMVSDWKFAPPTIKGKPVLVFTNRTITLEPKTEPNTTAEPTSASNTGK
jgi:hypothetical protein